MAEWQPRQQQTNERRDAGDGQTAHHTYVRNYVGLHVMYVLIVRSSFWHKSRRNKLQNDGVGTSYAVVSHHCGLQII